MAPVKTAKMFLLLPGTIPVSLKAHILGRLTVKWLWSTQLSQSILSCITMGINCKDCTQQTGQNSGDHK